MRLVQADVAENASDGRSGRQHTPVWLGTNGHCGLHGASVAPPGEATHAVRAAAPELAQLPADGPAAPPCRTGPPGNADTFKGMYRWAWLYNYRKRATPVLPSLCLRVKEVRGCRCCWHRLRAWRGQSAGLCCAADKRQKQHSTLSQQSRVYGEGQGCHLE